MDRKLNKYFLVLPILILIFGILSFIEKKHEYANNVYIIQTNKLFENFSSIGDILDSEKKNYLENNFISKFSVKEMRDKYIGIRGSVNKIITHISETDYKDLNEKYLIDILGDLLKVSSSDYLINDIFNSQDDLIIKNFEVIMDDFRKVLNKYNIFKINFGISSI